MDPAEIEQLWKLASRFWDEYESEDQLDDDGWCGFMLKVRARLPAGFTS